MLLDLDELSGLVEVDRERARVRVLAGTRLHQIPRLLAPFGLAMANLGDIDRQSIAGAISTGTHGTGAALRGHRDAGRRCDPRDRHGELLAVSDDENAELLPAVALGLGALGILVDVTLQCVPAFVLHAVERPEPLDDVVAALSDRVAGIRSLRVLLVSAHRRRPHEDEHAPARERAALAAAPRRRAGWTRRCWPTASTV